MTISRNISILAQGANSSGTLSGSYGGTGVTTTTGTGDNVLSTSPTLVTPILGTPASATLTNATGLPLTTGVTSTLPIANGGTNLTTVGSAGNVLFTTDGSVWSSTAKIVQGTVNAGGTAPFPSSAGPVAVDFTSIPSWVKRITIMLQGVSTASTGSVIFRIGTGGTPATTGYTSVLTNAFGTNSVNTTSSTAGFILGGAVATYAYSGNIFITNLTSNIWCCSGLICNPTTLAYTGQMAGSVSIGGTLDIVRMTTVGGTDRFDAGNINILYE
jgi:hypothetical protein